MSVLVEKRKDREKEKEPLAGHAMIFHRYRTTGVSTTRTLGLHTSNVPQVLDPGIQTVKGQNPWL